MLQGKSDKSFSKITDHLFSCFDQDSNGYLDFSEFIIAYSITSNGEPKKKLEFVFMFYVNFNIFDLKSVSKEKVFHFLGQRQRWIDIE